MLMAAMSASDTTIPLGYWPVSSSQCTVRPVLVGVAVNGVEKRHLGCVVDDRSRIIELAKVAGARFVEGPFLDFLDPWGNRLEIVEYSNIQFSKTPGVMRGMGLDLAKNANAKKELADKGMAE